MNTYEQYNHHGKDVWVNSALKGKHRNHCLCFSCDKFMPGKVENCHIAKRVYANCVEFDLVTPIYECPEFSAAHTQTPAA